MLLVATALVFAFCQVRLTGLGMDDAFIHRRIAFNYVHSGWAFYNPGQRVMVTSSPLWMVLLALASVVLPVENPVPWLEFTFALMGAAAAYLLACEEPQGDASHGVVFPALAFVAVCVVNLGTSVAQMESPCAIALMLTGCLGIQREKSWGMPLLLLACFARYECALLVLLAVVWLTIRRQWTKASLLGSIGICLLGSAWLIRQYGTVIPNTVVAKSFAYHVTSGNVARGLLYSVHRASLFLALGTLWWLFGRNRRPVKNSPAFLLAGFGIVLALAYIARKTFLFPWYLPLIWGPLSVGVLLWTERKSFARAGIGAVLAGALLLPFAAEDMTLVLCALRGAGSAGRTLFACRRRSSGSFGAGEIGLPDNLLRDGIPVS